MDKQFWPPILALLIPIIALLIPMLVVSLMYLLRSRRQTMVKELLLKYAELGQEPPAQLLDGQGLGFERERKPEPSREQRLRALRTRGVLFSALGLGLGLMLFGLNFDGGQGEWSRDMSFTIGLMPLFIGLGWLYLWRVERDEALEAINGESAPASSSVSAIDDAAR